MINAKGIGEIVGFFVGVLISIVLICICNRNRKVKSEYDERQKIVRGVAYTYGFCTLCIYLALVTIFSLLGLTLPIVNASLAFCGILCGITVTCIYSIWHEAYWGINNNVRRYLVVFAVAGIINLFVGISAIVRGTMCVDGIIQEPFINFTCGIMILIIGVVLFVKNRLRKNDEEERE